jgi:molybdenum cofactor guanylyltransferase
VTGGGRAKIVGVVLCGGRGERMGGGKAMRLVAGQPMAMHVAEALRAADVLCVSGDAEAAAALGAGNLDDPDGLERGPLAGVLAGLEWAAGAGAEWVVTAPCDLPFLPVDIVHRLTVTAAEAAYAETVEELHPLVAAWRVSLAGRLREALREGHPPVRHLMAELGAEPVRFEDAAAFMNVNTPEDLARAEARLAPDRP